jgi:putative peptide zinc metalloprotease protein
MPLYQLGKYLVQGNTMEKPSFKRFAITATVLTAVTIGLLMLPEPGGTRAPGIVAYEPLSVVRAPHSGFVREIHVKPGQHVKPSDILVVLENKDLNADLAQLQIEEVLSQQRSRIYLKDGDVAADQVETEMRQAFATEIRERKSQLSQSSVVAPAGGRVITRDLDSLIGSYVQEGEEILAIGNESQKEILMAVAQQDVKTFTACSGDPVDAFLKTAGGKTLECKLGTVDPRASQTLDQPALGANNGGPLAVQPITQADSDAEWELTEPRFVAKVKLTAEQSESLRTGQLATMRLSKARGTLGQFFYRSVSTWIERRLKLLKNA